MTRKLSNEGFAPAFVIRVLLIVAALGLGGFFVWQHSKKDDKASKTTTSTSQSAQSKSGNSTNQTADPTDGGKYLYIKEWGVRFQLPKDMRGGVTYGIEAESGTNRYSASFEVSSLNAIADSNCKLFTESDGRGTGGGTGVQLIRSPGPVDASDGDGIGDPIFTSADGKYYFYVATPKGLCVPVEHEQEQYTVDNALVSAIKSMEELSN